MCQLAWAVSRCFAGAKNFCYVEHLGVVGELPFASQKQREGKFEEMQILRFFRRLADVENDVLFEMTFESLSQLLISFANVRIKDDHFLSRACAVLGTKMDDLTVAHVQFIADVMWSLAILSYHAENTLFEKCIDKLKAFERHGIPIPTAANALIAITCAGEAEVAKNTHLLNYALELFVAKTSEVGEAIQAACYLPIRHLFQEFCFRNEFLIWNC